MEAEGSAPAGPSGSGGVRGAGEAGRGVAGGSAPIASVSAPAKDDRPASEGATKEWDRRSKDGFFLLSQCLSSNQLHHIKHLIKDIQCGPKAWKILKDVHAPSSEAMVVVLKRQLHAVKINEGDAVQGAFDQLQDLYVKLSAAGVDYPEKIKCDKALSMLPESWGPLVVNLNGMKDSWSLEWIRAQVLQEDFRRKELTAAAGEGAFMTMTYREDLLDEVRPSKAATVVSATGQVVPVCGKGRAMFMGAYGRLVGLKRVLLVPGLCAKFLSTKALSEAGMKMEMMGTKVELVHVDLIGPMKVKGDGGAVYSITMVEDYAWLTWSFPLAKKSDAARVIIEEWLPMVERESGKQVKAIRSDRGGEFLGAEFRSWLNRHGIKQQLTTAYTPQSNGVAERANRTIIEGGRMILVDSGLLLQFWPLAIRHATVIKNRVLTHVGGQHWVSMEKWSGKKSLVDMLRVFGCMGLVHVPKEKCDKLQAAAMWAVHLGLARGSKGWLMWDPKSNTIFTTRDAKFMEGLMFKEWSDWGRIKVTIPLGIEVVKGRQQMWKELQQGEAPVAERGDTEEEVQQPTPSPKLPPRRTTQGKRDAVRGGAKEGAAKERPKRAAHPRGFLMYERLGGPKALQV
ncbi:unnamed protein product [Closterium sp. NIES-53]